MIFDKLRRKKIETVSYDGRKELDSYQMREIELGRRSGVDVRIYSNPEFHPFQMDEIRKGLEAGVDASCYADPSIKWNRMHYIRVALERAQTTEGNT